MPTNIRSQFTDFFTSSKLPELEAVILADEESYPSMIPILFNEEAMSTDIYQTTTISGLRNPERIPENTNIVFQGLKSGYSKTYTAVKFGTGYRIAKEMVDDGKFNFIERATRSFSKGMFEIKEYDSASILDNGFTTTGYDGTYLFSTTHPLENGDGAVGINMPAATSELSITSFRELRNILQNTLNENGQFIKYQMGYLVVPQALQDVAAEIVKSVYNPENAMNAINTVYDSAKLLPGGFWNYLSSSSAWFIFTEKMYHHLMFLTRENLYTDSDYDKHAQCWELSATTRYDKGYSNWRGVCGNAGA